MNYEVVQLEALTDEELCKILAGILGWTFHDIKYAHVGNGDVFEKFWLPPGIDITTLSASDISSGPNYGRSLPDFTDDLNVIAKLEAALTFDQKEYFATKVYNLDGIGMLTDFDDRVDFATVFEVIHATARQRTIALILTLQPQS